MNTLGEKKTKQVKCLTDDCLNAFEVVYLEAYPDLHATHCDQCVAHAIQQDKAEYAKRITAEILDQCEIPESFQVWDDSKAAELGTVELLKWLSLRRNGSVLIKGDNQRGKSHTVGFAAYRTIINKATPCLFIHAPRWLTMLCDFRSGSDGERRHAASMISRATNIRFLVLDDLGNGKISPAKIDILWNLIDHRAGSERLKTWITTNHDTAQLEYIMGKDSAARGMIKRIERMVGVNVYEAK